MQLLRIARGSTRCVSLAQLKTNLRVEHTSEDDLMGIWIQAAEEMVESRLNRSIMKQTFCMTVMSIAPSVMLYRPAVDQLPTITEITTFDGDLTGEINPDDVRLDIEDMSPLVSFPSISRRRDGRIQIKYEAGQEEAGQVPAAIRQAVILLASNWYRSREAAPTDPRARAPNAALPFGADALIASYRIPNINCEIENLVDYRRAN